MPEKRNKPTRKSKPIPRKPKPIARTPEYWTKHLDNLLDGVDVTPQARADFFFAGAAFDLKFPNLIPGKTFVPEFRLAGETETSADRAAFAVFLDQHFPRSEKKFAEFRHAMDLAARGHSDAVLPRRPPISHPDRLLTAIEVYRFFREERNFLRSMSMYGEYLAKVTGQPPPPLRICDCGLLFLAARPNVKYHSKTCGSRVRMARARREGRTEGYELTRKLKGRPDAKRKKKKTTKRNPAA